MARMNLIAPALSSVTLGEPFTFESVTMYPLLGAPAVEAPPFYLTLDQAISSESTEITEVSDQGSVPELRVINKGAKPVFILDGEELIGAKQNRIVNLSILVPAQASLTIPVSCVEAGRWRARSRVFSTAPRMQYAEGRARRMSQVTMALSAHGVRHSDQAEVWADIAAKSERMAALSATGAMEEIFVRHQAYADRCVNTLRPVEAQCGALFLIGGRVVGFDLFDRAVTLRQLLPKLVRSVAVDAIDPRADAPVQSVSPTLLEKVAERFLHLTCAAEVYEAPAVGLGRDLRISSAQISGAALATDGSLVHLSAFHM